MSDQFDAHGPGEPHHEHEPAPPGDLPPDFVDDPTASRPSPPETAGTLGTTALGAPGSEFPRPASTEEPPRHPIFPVVMGFAMLAALAVAMFTNLNAAKETPAAATSPSATAVAPSPAPADEAAGDVKAIKTQVDDLAAHLKDLQGKVEGMPRAASREDLDQLQAKVAEMSKTPAADEALPKKVAALDDRVVALDKTLAELRDEVGALKADIKKAGEAASSAAARPEAAAAVADTARPADVDIEGQALSQGAELYEAGKYKEASDAFRKVTEAAPDDARGWYFAALSNGMATNQWRGETERLVNKGIEREKAGTPESSKIDPLFAKLPAKQKTWLDYYRQFAKKR
jgi:TolA-binding protein